MYRRKNIDRTSRKNLLNLVYWWVGGLNDQVQHLTYQVGYCHDSLLSPPFCWISSHHHADAGSPLDSGYRPSVRTCARHISRELTRLTVRPDIAYDASLAGYRARLTRCRPRLCLKLHLDGELVELVSYLLRKYWSPVQIARTLKRMFPNNTDRHVSLDYNALYLMPRGSLSKELR